MEDWKGNNDQVLISKQGCHFIRHSSTPFFEFCCFNIVGRFSGWRGGVDCEAMRCKIGGRWHVTQLHCMCSLRGAGYNYSS